MSRMRTLGAAVALGAALLCGSATQASTVTFVTTGTFSGGNNVNLPSGIYDNGGGVTVTFTSSLNNTVDAPPASAVTFGTFTVAVAPNATDNTVNTNFDLQILQTSGPGGAGVYTFGGSLAGTLTGTSSQAYVTFANPLTTTIGQVDYTITSADGVGHVPGTVALSPPSVNGGVSTISGLVNVTVPEPSSLALLGLGAPMLLAYRARRKRAAAV